MQAQAIARRETAEAPAPIQGRKLNADEAAEYLGVSRGFLDQRRVTGNGPAYLKLGRRVLYNVADLDQWVSAYRRFHTSEANDERTA